MRDYAGPIIVSMFAGCLIGIVFELIVGKPDKVWEERKNKAIFSEGYKKGVTESRPFSARAYDLNNDGIDDLVLQSTNCSYVLLGETNGTYKSYDDYKNDLLRKQKINLEELERIIDSVKGKNMESGR